MIMQGWASPLSLVAALCALVVADAGFAPARAQEKRLGSMATGPCPTADDPQILRPLAARGWIVGKNYVNDCIQASTRLDALPEVAAELVSRRPDVVLGTSSPFVRALMKATSTIPIVMYGIPDAVREGFVPNLNRPDGNVTGFSHLAIELFGKRIELLGEFIGKPRRVAVIFRTGGDAGYVAALTAEANKTATVLGFEWKAFDAGRPEDFDRVFAEIAAAKFDAVYLVPSPLANLHRARVAALALSYRLPTVSDFEPFAREGLLFSYGPDRTRDMEVGAEYVDRLLRGAKPSDLPVRQASEFRLVVNAQTADALGLKVPPLVVQRANVVID